MLFMFLALLNLIGASLNVWVESWGLATFNFGVFLFCMVLFLATEINRV